MTMPTNDEIYLTQLGILQQQTQQTYNQNDIVVGVLKASSSIDADIYNYAEQKLKNNFWLDNLTFDELKDVGLQRNLSPLQGSQSNGTVLFFGTSGTNIPLLTQLTANNQTYKTQQNAEIIDYSFSILSVNRVGTFATATTLQNHNLPTGSKIKIEGFLETNFNKLEATITSISLNQFTYEVNDTGATQDTNGTLYFNGCYVDILSDNTGLNTEIINGTSMSLNTTIEGVESVLVSFNSITGGSDPETKDEFLIRLKDLIINPYSKDAKSKIISTITAKFPAINKGVLFVGINPPIAVSSIVKDPLLNNNYLRKITCITPHGLRDLTYFKSIQGSNKPSLNISDKITNNRAISKIYNEYSFVINADNQVDEDFTSPSMSVSFTSPYSTIILYKSKSTIKTLSSEEINDVYEYLTNEVVGFENTEGSYKILSATTQLANIVISGLTPNLTSLKNAIIDNLYDYVINNIDINEPLQRFDVENIIKNTVDGNNNKPITFSTNLIGDIQPNNITSIISLPKSNITFSNI